MKIRAFVELGREIALFNLLAAFILLLVRNLNSRGLLFDQIIVVSLIATIVYLSFYFIFPSKSLCKDKAIILHSAFTSAILFILICTSTLVNIDRSRSFFILSWVNEKHITENHQGFDLTRVESSEKASSVQIEMRIEEQLQRNLIRNKSGQLRLTKIGEIYLNMANTLSKVYKLNGWKLNKQ